jgi:hypothetical protein
VQLLTLRIGIRLPLGPSKRFVPIFKEYFVEIPKGRLAVVKENRLW